MAWSRLVSLTALLGLVTALYLGFHSATRSELVDPALEFEMRSTADGHGQMLVDYGAGHNEADSTSFQVKRSDGYLKYHVRFPRKEGSTKSIRLDPIQSEANLVLRNARFLGSHGETLQDVPPSLFKPNPENEPLKIVGAEIHVAVPPAAREPILIIDRCSIGGDELLASPGASPKIRPLLTLRTVGWTLFALLCLAQIRFPNAAFGAAVTLRRAIAGSPISQIFCCAVAGAVVASYPVIVCGMSYVSPPAIGSLYSRFPWIPGYEFKGAEEKTLNADLGASYWTTIPNTLVQHQALFEFHEFPFWNRYVGGGIPLYAQGQSMICDPLHLIPVIARGSSLGWDLKTILEKIVFAAGIGILVHRLTGNPWAGMILAVAANFLGFHHWRFNHPALFAITYCPWVMLAWLNLAARLADPRAIWRHSSFAALCLAACAFVQLNSGATKEGVVAGAFAHLFGCALFAVRLRVQMIAARVVASTVVAIVGLALCTAPYWLLLADVLSESYTMYRPVSTLAGQSPLLFFEPLFLRPAGKLMTATNLPVLVGVIFATTCLVWQRPTAKLIACMVSAFALIIAFGGLPESLLVSIPLMQSIQHLGNTFCVAAITPVLVLAGFGASDFLSAKPWKQRWLVLATISVLLVMLAHWAGLWFLQASAIAKIDRSQIVAMGALGGFLIVLAGFLGSLLLCSNDRRLRWPWYAAGLCMATLFLRHGMHTQTGFQSVDRQLMNAFRRADFTVPSDAVSFITSTFKQSDEPSRVIGEGTVLFPGFNIRYLIEGVVPVEALRNRFMVRFLEVLDYPGMQLEWLKLIASSQLESRATMLDMLNVGYVLAMPETHMPPSLTLVHSADLHIWKRPSSWPRAFFTTTILPASSDREFAELVAQTAPPFAIVAAEDLQKTPETVAGSSRPAREYVLTTNSTTFTVDADGPGMIVLHEAYYAGDFAALVNGRPCDYIKVNGFFKGLPVASKGTYCVTFTYRPEKLGLAIGMALVGVSICVVGPLAIRLGGGVAGHRP